MTGDGLAVAFRLNGLLAPVETVAKPLAEQVLGRVKYLAKLQTWQDSTPQDGRIAKEEVGARHDLRVATYPTVTGEKIVIRLFTQADPPSLAELNLPQPARNELEKFLRQPSGMLLLTGPAGSGKTTTIYSCLKFLQELGDRHVITVEDPVEQVLPGIMQTDVNEAKGLTYPKAARHLLRQDPQVLVLGEIRDDETAQIAVRTALTGHQVITTLHAGSVGAVFERLRVMVPDWSAVVSSVALVLNQRLVRTCCESCAGKGCDSCLQTGFRGRRPIAEWTSVNDETRDLLGNGGSGTVKPSGQNLREQALALLEKKFTTEGEIHRILGA